VLAALAALAAQPAGSARDWSWLDGLTAAAAAASIVLIYGSLSLLRGLSRPAPQPDGGKR
jgi:hypothetical protein